MLDGPDGLSVQKKSIAQSARRRAHSELFRTELMAKFRFQDLKIWQLAIQIANDLFDMADELEEKRLYRFAEQLRAAGMSMPNNTWPVE